MHVPKKPAARGRRPMMAVLVLALLAAAVVLASSGLGSTGKKQAASAGPVLVGKGGGYGEVYRARASTLAHTLFDAKLLPKNPNSRNIALAAFGRPDKNYLTVVGEYTCNLGRAFAAVMNQQVGSGDIAFLGGFPGNPLSLGWQKCEQPALNPSVHIVANEPTNWDPSKVQSVVAGILAAHPNIKGWSYEYGGGMALGA